MLICRKDNCTCSLHRLQNCIQKEANTEAKTLLQSLENSSDNAKARGTTLLHWAVECSNTTMEQHLIEVGFDIDAQNDNGNTPLKLAITNRDIPSVELLLKNNADISIPNYDGINSLQFAIECRFNSLSLVCIKQKSHLVLELLFEKVNEEFLSDKRKITQALMNMNLQVVLAAVVFGSIELAKYLLKKGYSINYRESAQNYTALHWAVTVGKVENAKLLIKHGANINDSDGEVSSPLTCYTWNCEAADENSELLKIFLKSKTNSSKSEHWDLVHLLEHGNKETVRTVLKSGIHFTAMKFYGGKSFLDSLFKNQNDGVLDVLQELDIKLNVDKCDSNGLTPLMRAADSGSTSNLEFLLKYNANAKLIKSRVESTLYYALTMRNNDQTEVAKVTELLLQFGANAQKIYDGKSILELCSIHNQTLSEKVIIAHLALLNDTDNSRLRNYSRRNIESYQSLKDRFNFCTQKLEELKGIKMSNKVSFFELLSEKNEKKIINYARNQDFIFAFNETMKNMSTLEPYYFNTLQKKMSKALTMIELDEKVALVIEALTGISSDAYYHIVYQIISYLNPQDLHQLCKVQNISRDDYKKDSQRDRRTFGKIYKRFIRLLPKWRR